MLERVIIRNTLSPGDIIVLSAALRDIKKALEAEKAKLQRELQAKKHAQTVYAASLPEKPARPPVRSSNYYINWIIQHESGGDSYSVNHSSGACGLFQKLPCNVPLGNVEAQMADGIRYINNRYGSAYNAYLFWQSHGWF